MRVMDWKLLLNFLFQEQLRNRGVQQMKFRVNFRFRILKHRPCLWKSLLLILVLSRRRGSLLFWRLSTFEAKVMVFLDQTIRYEIGYVTSYYIQQQNQSSY